MSKEIRTPVVFKIVQYFADIEKPDGSIEKIEVDDWRLAGVRIPSTVKNPKEFLEWMKSRLDSPPIENETVPQVSAPVNSAEGIIRAKAPQKKDMKNVSNFQVIPKARYIYIGRDGKQDREREKIFCEITFNCGRMEHFFIQTKEITNLCKIIKKNFAIARIDFEVKNAEKWIEDEFREAVDKCRVIYRLFEQGWQTINGQKIYVSKSAKVFANVEYDLTANLPTMQCSQQDIGTILANAFLLYDDATTISTMIMFSFLGVLYRPFREAGYPPRFLLFLHGKTGSMKTTVAKILFTQLCDDNVRDTPRRIDLDTPTSFERAVIQSGYDTVTLIDDFNPAKTRKKKAEMEDKLESIIRLVGDMSSKSRSNVSLEDCRGEGVQGTVVLTGEIRGKGVSSNLRCLYCKMTREKANMDAITWFQENPAAYTTLISRFSEYVGKNWISVVHYIKENFYMMRKITSEVLSEKRLVDAVATLRIVHHMILRFLREDCDIYQPEKIWNVGNIEQNIVDNALMSQFLSSEDSPSVVFVKAISDLMRVNSIVLNTQKVTGYDSSTFDGFEDENYFYFNPELVFKKVRSFCVASNIVFNMDLKEIVTTLYDDGIIKTASNGKGKQTYCVRINVGNGKKQNFLKISKDTFHRVLDDSIDIVW